VRIVLQRVASASVVVEGEVVGAIGRGLLALVGVRRGDEERDAERLAAKVVRLRLFPDDARGFERSLAEVEGELLCVSQFTLHGNVRRGNRPSWSEAAPPEEAAPLVEHFARQVEAHRVRVARGRFGALMSVEMVNDGPVTLVLDSEDFDIPRRRA
jgi:D-aminoacyl-tRNA deacylase